VHHRTFKSGSRIEGRRLEDTESLEACLAIDLVVAWRVHWLTRVARVTPHTACAQILGEDEWRVVSAWANGKMAETVPSVQEAPRWIGKMGGWLARGKKDHPGTTCIWRDLVRLPTLVQGYLLALRVHGIRAGPCPSVLNVGYSQGRAGESPFWTRISKDAGMIQSSIVKLAEIATELAQALDELGKSGCLASMATGVAEHAHDFIAGLLVTTPENPMEVLLDEMTLLLHTVRERGIEIPDQALRQPDTRHQFNSRIKVN
jgi:Transposase Tn5 dimerisation domain